MTSFVVETFVPEGDAKRFAADVDGLRAAAEATASNGRHLHHVRSYLVPSDSMGFHVVEGTTAEDVVRLTELAHIEVERIVEAIAADEPPEFTEGGDT